MARRECRDLSSYLKAVLKGSFEDQEESSETSQQQPVVAASQAKTHVRP